MAEKNEKPKTASPVAEKKSTATTASTAAPTAVPPQANATSAAGAAAPTSAGAPAAAAAGTAAKPGTGNPAQSQKLSNQEDGAITEKAQLIIVSPSGEAVSKLKNIYSKDTMINIHEFNSMQVPQMARQVLPCIIMGSVNTDKDIVRLLNMLKALRDEIRHNKVKFLLFTKIKNNQVIKAFESMGCKEIVTEPINERSLKFKIDLHLKAAKAQRKSMRSKELQKKEDQKTFKADKKVQEEAGEEFEAKIKDVDAQGQSDDLFVFKDARPRKQGRRLVVRVKGPPEDEAVWAPVEKQKDGLTRFRLVPMGSNAKEEQKKAGWEFIGEKPLYNGGDWNLTGEKVELRYVDEKGAKLSSKFWMDEKGFLYLAKDTPNGMKVQEAREKRAQELKDQKKNAMFSGKRKDKEAREANDISTGDGENENPETEAEDYVQKKEENNGKELNFVDKKENRDGAELDYSEKKEAGGEGGALDYTEEKTMGAGTDLDYSEEKKEGSGVDLDYSEEKKQNAGTDLDYSEEKKQNAGTDLDYSEEKKAALGTDLDYSEEKKQSAATELDYSEKKKEPAPIDDITDGKIEWPEEGNLEPTPAPEKPPLNLEDTVPTGGALTEPLPSLPLPPMVAVYMAEILMRNKGDHSSTCIEFLKYISDFLKDAKVTLTVKSKTHSAFDSLYSTDDKIVRGTSFLAKDHPEAIQAVELGQTVLSKKFEGTVYIPVRSGTDPTATVLGMIIVESTRYSFKSRLRYFYSIGQCVRGVLLYQEESVRLAA